MMDDRCAGMMDENTEIRDQTSEVRDQKLRDGIADKSFIFFFAPLGDKQWVCYQCFHFTLDSAAKGNYGGYII
jgi:hypothetical protein